ncbi:MAG: VWA domain-containing protein [Lachnospiraceae bacterium]|nr:VWA domain-containing protein [Lachnospiraceae bacterium]
MLILLDNSLSVGRGNLAICRETIRYLSENTEEETELSLAVFGEEATLVSDFGTDREIFKERLYKIVPEDKDTCLTDVLMGTVESWRSADLADRAILLFTDGEGQESLRYAKEELYYRLAVSDYPVYIVDCVTKQKETLKDLSAIAAISGGSLFFTEFEDSEAEVERKLGEKVLTAMREKYELKHSFPGSQSQEEEEVPLSEVYGGDSAVYGVPEEEDAGASLETVTETLLAKAYGENETEAVSGILNVDDGADGSAVSLTEEENEPASLFLPVGMGFFIVLLILYLVKALHFKKRRKRKTKRGKRKIRQIHGRSTGTERRAEGFPGEETTLCLREEAYHSGETQLLFQDPGNLS